MEPRRGQYFVFEHQLFMVLHCGEQYIQTENCKTFDISLIDVDEFEELRFEEVKCVSLL